MLAQLDNLIRDHLVAEVPVLAGPQQILFQPPDDALRTDVVNLNVMVLNVYLVDIRENRRLRADERERISRNGDVFTRPPPTRVECHYLMSAWSPAQPAPAVEPTLDEHALLYGAAAALFRHAPLSPERVYPPAAPELALWPARYRDQDIPMAVAPPEGYPGIGDFWSTMGQSARWRPTLHLVATIPVDLLEQLDGPMVLTRFADYRITGRPDSAEVLVQIGGHVLRQGTPVSDARVNLETSGGAVLATLRTGTDGRFTFEGLAPDSYVLRTRAVGLPVVTRAINVPSATGEYDLVYP